LLKTCCATTAPCVLRLALYAAGGDLKPVGAALFVSANFNVVTTTLSNVTFALPPSSPWAIAAASRYAILAFQPAVGNQISCLLEGRNTLSLVSLPCRQLLHFEH
jgi:hypothetical protein